MLRLLGLCGGALLWVCCLNSAATAADKGEQLDASECLEQLRARYLDERRTAVRAIGKLPDDKQAEILDDVVELLDAGNWQTQLHAAKALAKIGKEARPLVPELIDRMKSAIKRRDVQLFNVLGDTIQGILPGKNENLNSVFSMMRAAAREGKMDLFNRLASTMTATGKESVPTLIKLVKSGDKTLRMQAITALSGLGDDAEAAVPTLVDLAADADRDVIWDIQDCLQRIKPDNEPPQVESTTVVCLEGESVKIDLPLSDSDDTPVVLRARVVEKPEHGELKARSKTSFIYTAQPGFNGVDTFEWVGQDRRDKSEEVTTRVKVTADVYAPKLVGVSGAGKAAVQLVFDEPLTKASAVSRNYHISGARVLDAQLKGDGSSVLLKTTPLEGGKEYTLAYANVTDRSKEANKITDRTNFTFHAEKPGLRYSYYTGKKNVIENPGKHEPKAEGTADGFSTDPAKQRDNYALVFEGKIKIPTSGKYTFYTKSDDGSFLWIDGKKLVDNGGYHGMEEEKGSIELTAGRHDIRVHMFQGGGGAGLEVRWNGPGIEKQEIPSDALTHTPAP